MSHVLLWTSVLLVGCAGSPPTASKPDYRPVQVKPAPPTGTLFAHCLADATASGRYQSANEPGTHLLLFTCTGETAREFYVGLAAWSESVGSQFVYAGRTFRSTARVRENLVGVDYCSTDGTSYECVITLRVGEFVQ